MLFTEWISLEETLIILQVLGAVKYHALPLRITGQRSPGSCLFPYRFTIRGAAPPGFSTASDICNWPRRTRNFGCAWLSSPSGSEELMQSGQPAWIGDLGWSGEAMVSVVL